jgi:signal transduction histidine kinase
MLIVMDAFLLFVLHLSTAVSLSIALLVCGVVWLPLRAWVWRRFTARQDRHEGETFGRVMDVALAPAGTQREEMWKNLLGSIFDPLAIAEHPHPLAADISILEDGQVLAIPMVGTDRVLHLKYARGGRALFTPQDVAMARELVTMLAHGIESLASYQKGVAEERSRIARDMHDNIGAQLLSALHSREITTKDVKIRETLADLREIINHAPGGNASLDETLAELRLETAERLDAAGMQLEWTTRGCEQTGVAQSLSHSIRSIIREAVSNAIRHSAARVVTVAIQLDGGIINLMIADDGGGFDPSLAREGQGLANIRTRVDQLKGSFMIPTQDTGTRLIIRIPVYGPLP